MRRKEVEISAASAFERERNKWVPPVSRGETGEPSFFFSYMFLGWQRKKVTLGTLALKCTVASGHTEEYETFSCPLLIRGCENELAASYRNWNNTVVASTSTKVSLCIFILSSRDYGWLQQELHRKETKYKKVLHKKMRVFSFWSHSKSLREARRDTVWTQRY